jgi:iron(III) transport system permease protein
MTTLSSIVFLVSPDHQMASARIFTLSGNARYGLACAMSTAIMGVVVIAMAGAWRLESASGRAPLRRAAPSGVALARG